MSDTLTDDALEQIRRTYEAVPFSPFVPAKPTGKQMAFLANTGKEALYGGTARSMKSWAALMAAAQYVCVPGYNAIIFRKERVSLELPDGLVDIAASWFSDSGAKWSGEKYRWTFPSGATISFAYLSEPKDLMKYHSSAYQFILFEEVAEWATDTEYRYMFSRCTPKVDHDGTMKRCKCHGWAVADVPLRVRATANPGGPGQAWVRANFILPWRAGQKGLFHPASYLDNPFIDHEEYAKTVAKMRPIDQARILGGDWDISAPGDRFARMWFKPMPEKQARDLIKSGALKIERRWDMAGTKVKKTNRDPDWTVGALVGFRETDDGEQWIILDIDRFRETAGGVIRRMKVLSKVDDKRCGRHIPIRVEREPGVQAKLALAQVKQKHFKGMNFRGMPSKINKEDRIDVLAVAAEVGYEAGEGSQTGVFYVEGADFVEVMLDEFEAYGNPGVHDDQPDAVSGAMIDISRGGGGNVGRRRNDEVSDPDATAPTRSGYDAYAPAGRVGAAPRSSNSGMGGYDL